MDRVRVQVQFKKVLWVCPVCGLEEAEDRNVSGGDSYVHTCANGHSFNQSGQNMREYNGTISYTEDEYAKVTEKDLSDVKTSVFDSWVYSIKNPPPYVEPTKEELRAEILQLEARKADLQAKIVTMEAVPNEEPLEESVP